MSEHRHKTLKKTEEESLGDSTDTKIWRVSKKIFSIAAIAVLFVVVIADIFELSGAIWLAESSSNWASTTGTINNSRCVAHSNSEAYTGPYRYNPGYYDSINNRGIYAPPTTLSATTYVPIVAYSYSVGTQEYEGQNISAHSEPSYTFESDAKKVAAQFKPGDKITVYYNPAEPSQSLLAIGWSYDLKWFFVRTIALLIFVFAWSLYVLYKIKSGAWNYNGPDHARAGI